MQKTIKTKVIPSINNAEHHIILDENHTIIQRSK